MFKFKRHKSQQEELANALYYLSDKYAVFLTKDDYMKGNNRNLFNNLCIRNGAITLTSMSLNLNVDAYKNVPIDSNRNYVIGVFPSKECAENAYNTLKSYSMETFMLDETLDEVLGLQVQMSQAVTLAGN